MIPEEQKFDYSFERLCIMLWAGWPTFMGEEIASLVAPDGVKEDVLHLSCIDESKELGDVISFKAEILERVNAVIQNEHTDIKFRDVVFHFPKHRRITYRSCIMGRTLEDVKEIEVDNPPIELPGSNELTGKFLEDMNPNSAVARCYSLFVGARRTRDTLQRKKEMTKAVEKRFIR